MKCRRQLFGRFGSYLHFHKCFLMFFLLFFCFSERRTFYGGSFVDMYARGLFDERNRPAILGALMEELMRRAVCNQLLLDPFSTPEPAPVTTTDEIMESIKRINRGEPIDLKTFTPHQLVIHLKLFFYFSCDSLLPSSDTIDGEVVHGYTPMFVKVRDWHSLEYNTTSIFYHVLDENIEIYIQLCDFLHRYMANWNRNVFGYFNRHATLTADYLATIFTPLLVFHDKEVQLPTEFVAYTIENIERMADVMRMSKSLNFKSDFQILPRAIDMRSALDYHSHVTPSMELLPPKFKYLQMSTGEDLNAESTNQLGRN